MIWPLFIFWKLIEKDSISWNTFFSVVSQSVKPGLENSKITFKEDEDEEDDIKVEVKTEEEEEERIYNGNLPGMIGITELPIKRKLEWDEEFMEPEVESKKHKKCKKSESEPADEFSTLSSSKKKKKKDKKSKDKEPISINSWWSFFSENVRIKDVVTEGERIS